MNNAVFNKYRNWLCFVLSGSTLLAIGPATENFSDVLHQTVTRHEQMLMIDRTQVSSTGNIRDECAAAH